jgi:hypothetical protein
VARQEAFQRLIPEPDPEELFTGPAARLTFTESETDASWTVARTRLGERSINVIPLDDLGDYFSFPGCSKPQQKNLTASREIEMAMLRQQIRISQNMVVQALLDQKQNLPEVFTGSPLLKDYFPLWLKEGVSTFQVLQSEYIVRLDHNLGLLINKKGGE